MKSEDLHLPELFGHPPLRESRREDAQKPSVLSFFTGIGGMDLAFENAGFRTVMQCEIDPFCQSVLKRHWPEVDLHGDIQTLSARNLPVADVWLAGFPCQDVSLARGNHGRNGLRGKHTSLFFKLSELAKECRPKVLLLENVVGLLNSHQGADFAIILEELQSIGYSVAWRVLNARYFGVPQSRSRVFLCAWLGSEELALTSLFEEEAASMPEPARLGFTREYVHEQTGAIVSEVAYCLAATSGRHTGNDWSRTYISYQDAVRRPTPSESERLQGLPSGWTIPNLEEHFNANQDSERYKAVGNSVAVPVLEWIACRIKKNLDGKPSKATALRIGCPANVDQFGLETVLTGIDGGMSPHRWKSGGIVSNGIVIERKTTASPSRPVPSKFVSLIDEEIPSRKYFLSANAAAGMIRRADKVGRNLFRPMRIALEKMLASTTDPSLPIEPSGQELKIGECNRASRSIQRRNVSRASSAASRSYSASV